MRISFAADEGGFDADEYTLACGVAGSGHYLSLQQDAEEADKDWGIHLEFDDQSNGDYDCVGACRFGPESLSLDLIRPLGGLAGVTGFDVHCSSQRTKSRQLGTDFAKCSVAI